MEQELWIKIADPVFKAQKLEMLSFVSSFSLSTYSVKQLANISTDQKHLGDCMRRKKMAVIDKAK